MLTLNTARIYFCLAALLFVAKPFLGFALFSRNHPPNASNIFIKAFTKRTPEYKKDSGKIIREKLAEPVTHFFLRFSFLLNIILPAIITAGASVTTRLLRATQLSLAPRKHTYLLNSSLII